MAGALLFDKKIRERIALFWFGLRDVGIIHSQAVIQRTIVVSPAFLEHGLAYKIAVCAHTTRDPNKEDDKRHFSIKRLRTLKSFHIFKTKIKKLKTLQRLISFSRPIQWYHSHADGTFKSEIILLRFVVDLGPSPLTSHWKRPLVRWETLARLRVDSEDGSTCELCQAMTKKT